MTNWFELDNMAHLEQVKAMDDLRNPRLRARTGGRLRRALRRGIRRS